MDSVKSLEEIELGNVSLQEMDPEVFEIIEKEKSRQYHGLELIASENFTSRAVIEVLGSCLTNKYSEGLPGARYYGGNIFIDQLENLCKKRALAAYRLDDKEWGVNVQLYSGSIANLAAYIGLIGPHAHIMGLNLPSVLSGGHLTHGYKTPKKKISATSIFFESMPYDVDDHGYIDYAGLDHNAKYFQPQLIICGASAYPRDWDYARMKQIADSHGSYLLCDMAHISGLIAAQEANNPFDYCDVVTSTTHKTLRGPRAGVIFFRKGIRAATGEPYDLEDRMNFAVFPTLQGGPHDNAIGAAAVCFREASTPQFKKYIQNVKANATRLAKELMNRGHTLVTNGTDNHLIVWDLRPHGVTGSKFQKLLEEAHITVNMNTIPGDKSAITPGGVRIGTAALASRGFTPDDMELVADILDRALKMTVELQSRTGKKLKDFCPALMKDEGVLSLRKEVQNLAIKFKIPGLVPFVRHEP